MLVCLLAALAESLLTIDGGIAAQDQLHCIVIVAVGWEYQTSGIQMSVHLYLVMLLSRGPDA